MKKQVPTNILIDLVQSYFNARAYAEVMREKVDVVYKDLLTKIPIYADNDWGGKITPSGKQLLKSSDLYLSKDSIACAKFYDAANIELRKCGLKPADMEDGYCPALVAETMQGDVERVMIDEMAIMLGLSNMNHKLLCHGGMESRQKFIDLTVKMVLSYCNDNGIEMKMI